MDPAKTIDLDALADALASRLGERLDAANARRFFSVSRAAEYADISTDSIRSLLAAGKLTALRPVPGRVVIDRRELDALLAASTRQPRRGRGAYDRNGG
jgi:excisionase family DNA binding protein